MIFSSILGEINHDGGWLAGEEAAAAAEGLDWDCVCTLLCATDFPCDLWASNSLAPLSTMGIMILFAVSRRLAKVSRCLAPLTWVLAGCRSGHLRCRDERGEREAKHIGNRWKEKGRVNGRREKRKR